ncbi:protein of unknown function [Burkholderia multivorans]
MPFRYRFYCGAGEYSEKDDT